MLFTAIFIGQMLDPLRIIGCGIGHYTIVRPFLREGRRGLAAFQAVIVAAVVTLASTILSNMVAPIRQDPHWTAIGLLAAMSWMVILAGLGRLLRRRRAKVAAEV